MPTLPAPYPFYPSGGDLPVVDEDDVRQAHPAAAQGPAAEAPVREALVAGETRMFLEYQENSAFAAQQSDPTRSIGVYLDGLAEDRSTYRREDEDNETLRERMLAVPEIVTPAAIVAAAKAILDPVSSGDVEYCESILDRLYIQSDSGTFWRSYIGPVDPDYPDRYYALRPNSSPGGPWVFAADTVGRLFVLRVPLLDDLDGAHAFLLDGSVAESDTTPGAWMADGSDENGTESDGTVATFVTEGLGSALDTYQAVASAIDLIKGQGIRWILVTDSSL